MMICNGNQTRNGKAINSRNVATFLIFNSMQVVPASNSQPNNAAFNF
jgi:hypothetical protein